MTKLMAKQSFMCTYDFKLDGGYCFANAAIGKDWLTIYLIETEPSHRRQGEATKLLRELKRQCAKHNIKLRLWCPLNDAVVSLCKKLNIETVDGVDN